MTGKGGMDKVKGKAKEAAAKMTGNRRQATEAEPSSFAGKPRRPGARPRSVRARATPRHRRSPCRTGAVRQHPTGGRPAREAGGVSGSPLFDGERAARRGWFGMVNVGEPATGVERRLFTPP